MAASRPLGATAACVILLSFSAGHRKLYWNGYIQVAMVICQQIFSILAPVFFLLKVLLKPFQNCAFFWLWRQDPSGLGAAISGAVVRSSIVLCKSFCV